MEDCEPTPTGLIQDVLGASYVDSATGLEQRLQQITVAFVGASAEDGLQGMLAGQIIMANAAAAECYRRAALPDEHPDYRETNLKLATKAQLSMARLVETLQKLKGKSVNQSVHLHHNHHRQDNRTQFSAADAVVNVSPPGAGEPENDGQPHEHGSVALQPGVPAAPDAAMRSEEPARDAVPGARDEGEEAL
ncbi:MAG: hypothetical protein AAGH41_00005 [Pseudomonadota bacterium]